MLATPTVSNLALVAHDDNSGGILDAQVVFTATDGTTYRIAVDGKAGAHGNVVLRWHQPTIPMFVRNPEATNVIANANENAYFHSLAVGNPNPFYQWRFITTNGIGGSFTNDMDGSTNATLTLLNVQLNNAGTYFCVATNALGKTNTSLVKLFVHEDSASRLSLWNVSSNQFRFHIFGLTNRPYRVETSTNLGSPTNWQSVFTNYVSYWYTNFFATNDP